MDFIGEGVGKLCLWKVTEGLRERCVEVVNVEGYGGLN